MATLRLGPAGKKWRAQGGESCKPCGDRSCGLRNSWKVVQTRGKARKGLQSRTKPCDRLRPTQGLPGPSGPEPRKSPKRVRKEYPGQGPKSAQRVRPGVSKESEKSLKSDFRTLFGLFRDSGAHSLGTFGALPRSSFRTLFGLFRGSGPEGPGRSCVGRSRSQAKSWKVAQRRAKSCKV